MKRYWECHVTIKLPDGNPLGACLCEQAVEELGWKFSQIAGDPVLGDGVKAYATMHYSLRKPQASVQKELIAVGAALQEQRFNVLRLKIERVEYDAIKGRDFK